MPHQVIKVRGQWALKTEWTPDFKSTILPKCRALPNRKFNPDLKVWEFSADGDKVLSAIEILKEIGVEIPKDLYNQAKAVVESTEEDVTETLTRIEGSVLAPYQKKGVEALARNDSFLLSDMMGLGKTPQAIFAIPDNSPVLVTCPASLKGNWKAEFEKFRPGDFRITILKGRKSFRFPEAGEVLIGSWDSLPKEAGEEEIPEDFEAQVPMGLVHIGDEVHAAKNPKALRTKRYKGMNTLALKYMGKAWGMTGTPLLNRPLELWQILDTLSLTDKVFGSFGNFYKLFNARKDAYGTTWGLPDPEVAKRLSKGSLRRLKKDVLSELPEKSFEEITIDIKDKSLKGQLDEIYKGIESGQIPVLSNGLPGFEEMSTVRKALASHKIPVLLDRVEVFEEEETPLVVFSDHRDPIESLGQREGWEIITGDTPPERRTEIVKDFQDGKLKGIGATIKAGGTGLTLTHASHMIFVDLNWTPALNTQAEDRIHRRGQKNACSYLILKANHPLDNLLYDRLSEKVELEDRTFDGMDERATESQAHILEGVEVTTSEEVKTYKCLVCDTDLLPRISKSAKNPGREYIAHQTCEFFCWTEDYEKQEKVACSCCGAPSLVKTSKKHDDRRFVICPTTGMFRWIDLKAKEPTRSEQIVLHTASERAYTDAEKAHLTESLRTLLRVCDGAHMEDYAGFNAPDAPVARLYDSAISEGRDVNWQGLDEMLAKYRNTQL